MPPLPKRALRYGQLEPLPDEKVPSSGHKVDKFRFEDPAKSHLKGDERYTKCFFKPISYDYPVLAAKFSVAMSVLVRLMLGENAAEERLVYNDQDEIVGTVSLALANLKTMATKKDKLPSNLEERERVCPSTQTLLEKKTVEPLMAAYVWGDDDRHPGNVDLEKIFDYDMFGWSEFMEDVKGERLIAGVVRLPALPTEARFTEEQVSNWPILEGRTHWPTNDIPGNIHLGRICAAKASFQELAANPSIQTDKGVVTAQEESFTAMLKLLITYEPQQLRALLSDYLGDEKLSFLDLPEQKHQKLSKRNGKWFNTKTNDKSFIKFFLKFTQMIYDKFYACIVFYEGTASNIKGVPVCSFRDFLSCKPSAIHTIMQWAEEQNKIELNKREHEAQARSEKLEAIVLPYDTVSMLKRGHQIRRDSLYKVINAVQLELAAGKAGIINLLRKDQLENDSLPQFPSPTDPKITHTKKLVNNPSAYASLPPLDCDKENPIYKALLKIHELDGKLQESVDAYFEPECAADLTEQHNINFCKAIHLLTLDYGPEINRLLGKAKEAETWAQIIAGLYQFGQFNFNSYLYSKDKPLGAQLWQELPVVPLMDHTDKQVVDDNIESLFNWIETQKIDKIKEYVLAAKKQYSPPVTMFSTKKRADEVDICLSSHTDSVNLVARIFSAGENNSHSLNSILIKILFNEKIREQYNSPRNLNLTCLKSVISSSRFKAEFYAEAAQRYARTNERFHHSLAESNPKRFNQFMYEWADKIDEEKFQAICQKAFKDYKGSSSWFGGKRCTDLNAYYSGAETNADILIKIFAEGDKDSTLSAKLFEHVMQDMMEHSHKGRADYQLLKEMTGTSETGKEMSRTIKASLKKEAVAERDRRSSKKRQAKANRKTLVQSMMV